MGLDLKLTVGFQTRKVNNQTKGQLFVAVTHAVFRIDEKDLLLNRPANDHLVFEQTDPFLQQLWFYPVNFDRIDTGNRGQDQLTGFFPTVD